MSQEKRTLLALLVSFLFCAFWVNMMQEKHKKWALEQERIKKEQEAQKLGQPVLPDPNAAPPINTPQIPNDPNTPPKPPVSVTADPNAPVVASELGTAAKEELITIDTPEYQMVWTNRGGVLVSLKFKQIFHNYTDFKDPQFAANPDNWLEVMPPYSEQDRTFALLRLDKDGKDLQPKLAQLLWKSEVTQEKETSQLTFQIGPIDGIIYRKVFQFSPNRYGFDGKLILENRGEKCYRKLAMVASAGIELDSLDSEAIRNQYAYYMYLNPKGSPIYENFDYKKVSEGNAASQKLHWVGLTNRYFAQILHFHSSEQPVPWSIEKMDGAAITLDDLWVSKTITHRRTQRETVLENDLKKIKPLLLRVHTNAFELNAGETTTIPFEFYVASKSQLGKINKQYQIVEDYGTFGFISNFLLWIMGLFYRLFNNYGVAIIFLTLVVKLILFPITKRQQISMAKYQKQMKIFQPQLRALQDRYQNDRQKMNEEMMKLYKQHGINPLPLGGCLPIFLQLPIFMGLYQALYYSLELRQASFLWIADLSQPDHLLNFGRYIVWMGDYLNILPIIMTVVWIIQQKSAPKPDDPQMQQQQKMFLYMTVFFGFMFYHAASGLVLYWMVMNVFSIAEQWVIKKQMPEDLKPK